MGDPACYLDFCPECDAQVTTVDDECPDCGAALDDRE
ncbi:zinc-ribbon domain-containing protein [Haladaptatus salinisoli]